MRLTNCLKIVSVSLMFLCGELFSQSTLDGKVTDDGSEPVQGALVELIDQADATRKFSSVTDENGRYVITISATAVGGSADKRPAFLLHNHPNPFNPSTIIICELPEPQTIRVEIYNVLGQKIKTVFDGFQTRVGQFLWDGADDSGRGVTAGVYLCAMTANGVRIIRKMLLVDGHTGVIRSPASQAGGALGKQALNQYLFRISGDDIETYEAYDVDITGNQTMNVTIVRTVTDNSQWANLTTGAWCAYNNDPANAATYGLLYNWYAVNDSRKIAPNGWHVPTDTEWQILVDYLGGSSVAGGKMKEAGTAHWNSPNTGATNESRFSGLPGGCRYNDDGYFASMDSYAYFWSSAESHSSHAWYRIMHYDLTDVYRYYLNKPFGFSVRCVRD
ncbi:T9SS type A sorting domain-containing protein [candidate division KSB1 bacterium]|nr:T9SS type A sorting domain-containing protein [candidate division KSB1 bacterium]RQW06813.1 MAG: T9SS C-terminal target domain-containing protein [candidate division KSB1 bacterium]